MTKPHWDEIKDEPALVLTHPPQKGEEDRDKRYTPGWCTHALIDWLEGGGVLHPNTSNRQSIHLVDPCCGQGGILRVLDDRDYRHLIGVDTDGAALTRASEWLPRAELVEADCRAWLGEMDRKHIYITNPPYSIGAQVMAAIMNARPHMVCALLRLNHLGSGTWFSFWRQFPPMRLLVLGSKRPSFTGDSKTDASEYCWCVWESRMGRGGIHFV